MATLSGAWTLLSPIGGTAVSFTSFISIDYRNGGEALSYPVEMGGFANYNKTQAPLDIKVALAKQGSEADFAFMLALLDQYRKNAVTLGVVTPSALYQSMTLKSYSYKRGREDNAGMLSVELELVEVRDVSTNIAASLISAAKNATSFGTSYIGMTQPSLIKYL